MQISIDKEFAQLLPPLPPDEHAQLEASLLSEGCRDALVLWRGTLIDGHNRLKICGKHGIKYRTDSIDLPDRQAALNWIINNQLSRRNLTPEQMSYLRGKRYNGEKTQGERKDLTSGKSYQKSTTAEKLAKEYKVSEKTIRNDGEFASAVDQLPGKFREKVLARESGFTKADVVTVALLPDEVKPAVIEQVTSGQARSIKEACQQVAVNPKSEPHPSRTVSQDKHYAWHGLMERLWMHTNSIRDTGGQVAQGLRWLATIC